MKKILYIVLLKAIMFHFLLGDFLENLNKSPIELIFFLMTNYRKNFIFIVGDSDLEILSFIDLCFIAFLLTSYSL